MRFWVRDSVQVEPSKRWDIGNECDSTVTSKGKIPNFATVLLADESQQHSILWLRMED